MSGNVTKRHPRVVDYRLTGGEALLLHLDTGAYHELNTVGSVIWDLLDGERSVEDLSDALAERLLDPPSDLESVVVVFLENLRQRGLLA